MSQPKLPSLPCAFPYHSPLPDPESPIKGGQPSPFPTSPSTFPSIHLPFPSLHLEVGPLNIARVSGKWKCCKFPQRSLRHAQPQQKSHLVHFSLKIWHLVALAQEVADCLKAGWWDKQQERGKDYIYTMGNKCDAHSKHVMNPIAN